MNFPYSFVDLTHTLEENIPSWDAGCGFKCNIKTDYDDCNSKIKFRVQHFQMDAGIGTHIDAPAHCNAEGLTVDQIPLSHLISPCITIDVSKKMHECYSVSRQDILDFESTYSTIPKDTFVMIKTGWEKFWREPDKYKNNFVFPSVSEEAAKILLERDICGLGIDTLSPDRPADGFPVHKLLLDSNKYIIENAANLNLMPLIGHFIMIIPIKIKEATETPIRLIGLIPHI